MPEAPTSDNPAVRLHAILSAQRACGDQVPVKEAWARVLDCDSDDMAVFFQRFAAVADLPGQISERLTRHPDAASAPHLMDWWEPVHQSLAQIRAGANANVNATQPLTDAVMASLAFVGWIIRTDAGRQPTEDEVAELLSVLDQFEQQVIDAEDIASDLRLYLLEHTRQMRTSILLVKVKGADALRDAAETGFGGAVFWITAEQKDPFVERLWAVATKVATVAQLATTGVAIGAGALPALPG